MGIKASNNVFPHNPDDNWKEKLDRGGYTGTAQDLKNEIDQYVYPDDVVVSGEITKVDNTISIDALAFTCRIDNQEYSNTEEFSTTIVPADEGYRRIDILVFTKYSNIVKIQGIPGVESAQEPDIPDETIKIAFFNVFGSIISDPEVPPSVTFETRIALLENNKVDKAAGKSLVDDDEIEKLAVLDPTADIDKPVSTAQADADADTLADSNAYTDAGLALKLNTADYNNYFKGKFTSLASLEAAYPTANVGDSAQVDEGTGFDVVNYNWDSEEGWVIGSSSGSGATNTDALPEGSSNLYFTTARVLATALAGLSAVAGTFTSSDSLLTAFGKIKYLIDNIASTYQAILTDVNFGAFINSLTAKTTPVDADSISIVDSADSDKQKKVSLTNFKAYLLTYFDTKYAPVNRLSENTTVTGAYNLDWNYETHRLTLTGATTLTDINLPSTGFTKTITLHVNGNFSLTYPAGWTTYISGAYVGTSSLNTIVAEYIKSGVYKIQISQ